METTTYAGRAMPIFVHLPMLVIGVLAILALTRRLPSPGGRMLVIAVGMRPLLSAAWQYTFAASPLGLSWNALSSVIFFIAGVFVVRRRSVSPLIVLPFVPLIAVTVLSGVLNDALVGLSSTAAKLGYVVVVSLLVLDAAERHGIEPVMRTMVLALLTPLVFQVVGTTMGLVKQSEADGSAAYIGGFFHESAFSLLLCGTMLAVCLLRRVDFRIKLAMIAWCAIGIVLGNYRTALIAIVPLVAVSLLTEGARRFVPRQRAIIGALLVMLIAAGGLGFAVAQQERFGDLAVLFSRNTELIKRPDTFSVEDRHVMNGRPLIWSTYYYAWGDSSPRQHLIGLGPDSWTGRMRVYAHNTIVSALYEVGLVGVGCYLLLWGWFIALALLVPGRSRWLCLAGHLSFLLLNMATMPMWSIEGLIYYGLLCGYTAFMMRSRRAARATRPVPRFAPIAVEA